ncbi:iron-containing alcohol dehydrogenase, partial [uncultured Spongiibacter sp.]
HVLRFNAAEAAPLYAELAELLVDPQRLSGDSESRCAQFISDIEQLIARLQLPTKLAKLDVPEADLPMLASDAMLQQRLLVNNPRPVSEADALALYRAAYA